MEPARMLAEVRLREVLGVFMGLELVFGFVGVTELLLEDGVFMGVAGKWLYDGEPALFLFFRKRSFIIFFSGFPRPQTAMKSPVPAAPGASWVVR